MKKTYFIILSAALALASTVATAKIYDGGIKVSNAKLTPVGKNLCLTMSIDIEDDAVGTLNGIAIVPYMSDGTFEADFPYALVNGRNRNNIFNRHTDFGYEGMVDNMPVQVFKVDKKGRGGRLDYEAEINHDAWMDHAALLVKFVLVSPAGVSRYYAMGVSCVRAGAHKHHVAVPPPAPVFIEPEPVVELQPVVEIEYEPDVEPTPGEPKIHTYNGSAFLDFEAGKSVLLHNYKRNALELAMIRKAMDEVISNHAKNISIIVTGNASPDGRWSANEDLALHRAMALEKYLQHNYGRIVSVSKVLTAGEDWSGLRKMVEGSNMAYKSAVLQIIDLNENPDVKESILRRLADGSVWATMTKDFFPQLRRVDYNIMYEIEE